jgi:hypothetical protein
MVLSNGSMNLTFSLILGLFSLILDFFSLIVGFVFSAVFRFISDIVLGRDWGYNVVDISVVIC